MYKQKVWFWCMSITSVLYIIWRLLFTIPTTFGMVSLVAGIALFVAECISVLEAIMHCICMHTDRKPNCPVIAKEDFPDIDVLITTHDESTTLLFQTINGCKHMAYPEPSKVHIYVCDDTCRPEMRTLAQDMGVGYFGWSENTDAKAGNLNMAIAKTNAPLIATFDADMIPKSRFLLETVPYFALPDMIQEHGVWRKRTEQEKNPDEKIGLIQTPQNFYNADLFQFDFFAEKNIPNEQDYFFKEVNVGRNKSNSVIYAGSNAVLSRRALEEVGGIRTKTITEDFATGMDIEAKGYQCFAIDTVLASGLAPYDFAGVLQQRQRWARGCIQTICSTKFWFGKLPLFAKASYICCLLYWWTFFRRFLYILSPILFAVFGVVVVKTSVWGILLVWLPAYLIYNHTLKLLSANIRDQKWSNIVDTILFPYMIVPIFAESIGLRLRTFSVTKKETTITKSANIIYAVPHMLLWLATLVGICFCVSSMWVQKSVLGVVVLFWLCMNGYFLTMAIFCLFGRKNERMAERFKVTLPVCFAVGTQQIYGTICDIATGGFAFQTDFPVFLHGVCTFTIQGEAEQIQVAGQVVYVTPYQNQWKYGIRLEPMDKAQKQAYTQLVFDRMPPFATTIQTSALQDLFVFCKAKLAKPMPSRRKLPRMLLNCVLQTDYGATVVVHAYNYQYMTIREDVPMPSFCVYLGEVPLCLQKKTTHLYAVENWETISVSEALRHALEQYVSK